MCNKCTQKSLFVFLSSEKILYYPLYEHCPLWVFAEVENMLCTFFMEGEKNVVHLEHPCQSVLCSTVLQ